MPKYTHRKTGKPVTAVQHTSPASVGQAIKELNVIDFIDLGDGLICLDGVKVRRGQYAVMTMFSIVAVDPGDFVGSFRIVEIQEELF